MKRRGRTSPATVMAVSRVLLTTTIAMLTTMTMTAKPNSEAWRLHVCATTRVHIRRTSSKLGYLSSLLQCWSELLWVADLSISTHSTMRTILPKYFRNVSHPYAVGSTLIHHPIFAQYMVLF